MEENQKKEYFSAENFKNNMLLVDYVRSFMAIISGSIAGVWGFTGIRGFVFLFITHLLTSAGLLVKMSFGSKDYVHQSPIAFIINGLGSQFLSFVLFWTLFYALIHLY